MFLLHSGENLVVDLVSVCFRPAFEYIMSGTFIRHTTVMSRLFSTRERVYSGTYLTSRQLHWPTSGRTRERAGGGGVGGEQRDRQTDRDRERKSETDTERDKDRQRARDKHRQRHRDTENNDSLMISGHLLKLTEGTI